MFGQPMKVGLKTSNLPDETIDDIRTEEELKENIDSIEHGNLPMENEAAEDAERSCGSRDNVAGNVEGAVELWPDGIRRRARDPMGVSSKPRTGISVEVIPQMPISIGYRKVVATSVVLRVQGISHRRDWCVREDEEPAFKDGMP